MQKMFTTREMVGRFMGSVFFFTIYKNPLWLATYQINCLYWIM